MAKANQTLPADRLNELTDHFMQLCNSDHYGRAEMEEKDGVNKENARNMAHKGN